MTPELLLKAYVHHGSEEAFRELVASTLDEQYSVCLQILHGNGHLAEQVVAAVYLELARKAPSLRKDLVISSWLRQRVHKMATTILKDARGGRAASLSEPKASSTPTTVSPAPVGMAARVCDAVFLKARKKDLRLFSIGAWLPVSIRPLHLVSLAVCVVAIVVWWKVPFHHRNPIVRSQGLYLTPSSFAQLGTAQDGQSASTNAGVKAEQK
ncbi:MAG TPA: hypothetical protein VLT36_07360 [Candidatus Dormibacteraeota bacterium]|nr:hypothetical protein [Candidatus Dormibacteraeota bacterium]